MTAPVFYPRGPLPVEFMAEIHRRISRGCIHLRHTVVDGEPCLQILDRTLLRGEPPHVSIRDSRGSETIFRHADYRNADEFSDAVVRAMAAVFVEASN